MAYLCPVCEAPQVDAGHLANHLAFTALIRGGDHEVWLDEHAPGWDDHEESWLATRLREAIDDIDHPIDDVETHDDGGHAGHDHDEHGRARTRGRSGGRPQDPTVAADAVEEGALDDDATAIVDRARELTRQMAEEGEDEASDAAEHEPGDGDSAEGETD